VTAVYTTAALDESGEVTSQRGIDVEQIRDREKRGLLEFADLIQVPDEQGSFCNRESDTLIVTVRNRGVASAGRRQRRLVSLGMVRRRCRPVLGAWPIDDVGVPNSIRLL
jgi:hypothetical protein